MSVRKDPRSPYYQYDFQRLKQRFHGSTGCTTRRDAERFEADLRRRIALGDESKPQITVEGACEALWTDRGQHEKSSATVEYQLANLVTIIGAKRLLRDVRQRDFRDYIAHRRAQGVGNASINRERELARRVWKHALAGGFDVPVPGTENAIDWKALKLAEQPRVRELTDTEETALMDRLGADLGALVEFALLSGQRKSALVGLQWQHVDLAGARARVHTKGDRWHTFPLSPRMIELLLDRPTVDGVPFVFTYKCLRHAPARQDRPRRVKGQRYAFSKQGWTREWRAALKAAGVSDFRFHDLRHTRATRVVRATGNLKAAGQLLGHTNISTTARYAHVAENDLRHVMLAAESRNSHGGLSTPEAGTATKTAENETAA